MRSMSDPRSSLITPPKWKFCFDLCVIAIWAPIWIPVCAVVALLVLLRDGRPVFFLSPRVGLNGTPFRAFKFRTMRLSTGDTGGVTGPEKSARITPLGRVLRRARLDELPQIINVMCGDMSLVGPRPPDPIYVRDYPEIYQQVLQIKPGMTGLATLQMHRYEERVLGACDSVDQVDRIYRQNCIPRKARLDALYLRRLVQPRAICFDIILLARTVRAVFH